MELRQKQHPGPQTRRARFAALALIPWMATLPAARALEGRDAPAPAPAPALADVDKSGYTFLNPTPDHLMRPLSADRPDKTESPYTVDAGHVQLEMDLVNLTETRRSTPEGPVHERGYEVAPFTLKLGLLNQVDLQAALVPYSRTRETATGQRTTQTAAFEEITPRLKINLFGNDTEGVAMGLIPYATVPLTRRDDGEETLGGGVALPVAFAIGEWDFGVQTAWSLRGIRGDGVARGEIENSLCASHALVGKVRAAAEFYSRVETRGDAGWVGTVNTWLTLEVSQNWLLESGIYIGVTPAAEDWHPWVGMTIRY